MGSGCGSVGRAVAFDTRGPRFDSSHRQNFIEHLFIINCIEKTKIKKKRPGMAHFFLKKRLFKDWSQIVSQLNILRFYEHQTDVLLILTTVIPRYYNHF